MKRINYRCFSIYAEPGRTSSGRYDVRVVMQKIGTSKISLHRPDWSQPTAGEAEDRGLAAGKEIVEGEKCPDR